MFVVLLKFSANRDHAGQLMAGHRDCLQQGFDDGVFLLAGSLQSGLGGSILAQGTCREALQERINKDPFVAEYIVTCELLEMRPSKADERLTFLLN